MRVLISVYVSGWSARVKPLGIDSPFPRAIGPPSHKTYRHITEWARLPATENPARHRRARPSGNLPPRGCETFPSPAAPFDHEQNTDSRQALGRGPAVVVDAGSESQSAYWLIGFCASSSLAAGTGGGGGGLRCRAEGCIFHNVRMTAMHRYGVCRPGAVFCLSALTTSPRL